MVPSELFEFPRCSAPGLEAADAQLDLHLHRKERRASSPSIRFRKSPPDRGRRGNFLPLQEAEQRQAWLRLTTAPDRLLVGFLGRCNLSEQSM
jgi:hypothetical protein